PSREFKSKEVISDEETDGAKTPAAEGDGKILILNVTGSPQAGDKRGSRKRAKSWNSNNNVVTHKIVGKDEKSKAKRVKRAAVADEMSEDE
ncbi:hypothetical protein H0H93_005638, partial [Arthromyces matolae]